MSLETSSDRPPPLLKSQGWKGNTASLRTYILEHSCVSRVTDGAQKVAVSIYTYIYMCVYICTHTYTYICIRIDFRPKRTRLSTHRADPELPNLQGHTAGESVDHARRQGKRFNGYLAQMMDLQDLARFCRVMAAAQVNATFSALHPASPDVPKHASSGFDRRYMWQRECSAGR